MTLLTQQQRLQPKKTDDAAKVVADPLSKAHLSTNDPPTEAGAGNITALRSFAFDSCAKEEGEDGAYTYYVVPFKVEDKPATPLSMVRKYEKISQE